MSKFDCASNYTPFDSSDVSYDVLWKREKIILAKVFFWFQS